MKWDDVVAIASRFPEVSEGTSYGTPALRVKDKFLCRMRTNPDALVVRVIDVGDQQALLQGEPDVFFTTPHYDGSPYVLVRLETVALRDARGADRGRVADPGAQARDQGLRWPGVAVHELRL